MGCCFGFGDLFCFAFKTALWNFVLLFYLFLLVHFNWSALEFLLVKIYLYLLLFFDIFTQKIIKKWYGKSHGRIGLALVLSNDDSKTLRPKQKSLTIHSDKGLTFVTTKGSKCKSNSNIYSNKVMQNRSSTTMYCYVHWKYCQAQIL